jgi:hypothetical protein
MRRQRDRTEHSRVLSDVTLGPEIMNYSVVWLAKVAVVCIVILAFAMIDIGYLPIAIGIDLLLLVIVFVGGLLTPEHFDSFGELISVRLTERWGQELLATNPTHTDNNDHNNDNE